MGWGVNVGKRDKSNMTKSNDRSETRLPERVPGESLSESKELDRATRAVDVSVRESNAATSNERTGNIQSKS